MRKIDQIGFETDSEDDKAYEEFVRTLKVTVIVMVTEWPQKSYFFEDRMNF